jgi:hypothetical protein
MLINVAVCRGVPLVAALVVCLPTAADHLTNCAQADLGSTDLMEAHFGMLRFRSHEHKAFTPWIVVKQ